MGILDAPTSQTVDKIPAPGHAPGRVMSRGWAASEPASPPATTWGSGGGGGGRNAGSAARCQPEPLQPSAGGSGGVSRADLGERRLLVVGGGHFVSPRPEPRSPTPRTRPEWWVEAGPRLPCWVRECSGPRTPAPGTRVGTLERGQPALGV